MLAFKITCDLNTLCALKVFRANERLSLGSTKATGSLILK